MAGVRRYILPMETAQELRDELMLYVYVCNCGAGAFAADRSGKDEVDHLLQWVELLAAMDHQELKWVGRESLKEEGPFALQVVGCPEGIVKGGEVIIRIEPITIEKLSFVPNQEGIAFADFCAPRFAQNCRGQLGHGVF